MASIGNLYAFGDWFSKPPNPLPPLNLLSLINHKPFHSRSKFCSISASSSSDRTQTPSPDRTSSTPGYYDQMLSQYFWECQNLPDFRHTPQVEEILKRDAPLTPEEKEQVDAKLRELRSTSPMIKFLARAEEIADDINAMQLKANESPYHSEDAELWKKVPHVEGLDGRPMVRKAIRTKKESDDKFWDFTKQFLFGLWGFRQRPYPSSRPIDVAQAIGYKRLEKRYYDFIMRSGGWFYKDRLGRTRGPLELITLKTAWGAGIIDKDTFIWGEDMDEWAPIHMVYGMERAIATWEVRFGAAATEFIHKLQKGIPPWVPLKGREKKTFKQLQDEAVQSKKRDLAVLEANGGVWPGVRTPSHALFLWAGGSELTSILEADHMPNKYIPKDLRKQLQKVIPGLRPWEVLSVEQAMDQITYGGEWYREPLGSYTTGPPYIEEWNRNILKLLTGFYKLNKIAYDYMQATLPGFNALMGMTEAQVWEKLRKQKEKELAEEKEELKKILARRLKKGQ